MPTPLKTAPLGGFELLGLHGRDALAFAQAQFCNDVRELAVGHWQWSGWLTPKGRVVALFALLRSDEDRLWLVLPDAPAEPLAAQLQGFVFRSRVALERLDDWVACAAWNPAREDNRSRAAGDAGSGWTLDFGGDGGARQLQLRRRHELDSGPDASIDRAWRLHDIRHGLPRLPFPADPGWTPQMLSLQRLHAYSVKKGCYPGQEIVARTHFLGQAKRGLARLRGEGPLPAQGTVTGPDGRSLGPLVCSVGDGGGSEALAVLAMDSMEPTLCFEGQVLERLPLLGGLAR